VSSPVSIVTGMTLASSVEDAWGGLMLYEQIPGRPPWLLRILLPEPRGTEGSGSAVGNEVLCVYESGFLRKRVTRVDPGRRYDFEVVEQRLTIAGGIRLVGGSYSLRAITEGSTRVELETRYVGRRRPRWLSILVEAAVCRAFHRHLLAALRRAVGAAAARIGDRATVNGPS
jgi:hypothetical protein